MLFFKLYINRFISYVVVFCFFQAFSDKIMFLNFIHITVDIYIQNFPLVLITLYRSALTY